MPILVLLAAVSAWLWPIGLGGRMPVGGDVTQFSMGLMAFLRRSLVAGRLPAWNDQWGFGFPGLAESQMGVYYPPHLVLYGLLPTEWAYTASLVLHTYFAAMGAYWMARTFGISPWGAALSGWAWSASGMFLIHLPHQWGYTSGSWMPWAIGLGWTIAKGKRPVRSLVWLSAVLAMQILPGHFQFAFQTQTLLGLMALGVIVTRPRRWISAVGILLAIAFATVLSAAQMVPTWELAKTAQGQRSFDFLSAFASPPPHLISYVAPNLFHVSPLWRPLAWDPFHAMPEEHRPYIGLIPLMLAIGALRRGLRTDRGTTMLAGLAIASTLFSFGPYIPGFGWLIRLPGFSFFRAPSRWGLPACLLLAGLAGKGFDGFRSWPNLGRSTARFCTLCAVLVALTVGLVELTFASTEGAGIPSIANMMESARSALPWRNDPTFRQVMANARRGPRDPLIITGLIGEGVDPAKAGSVRLDRERHAIYVRELAETAALIGLLAVFAIPLSRGWRGSETLILLIAFADLMLLGRHRAIETAPIRPLVEQSRVLSMMAALPPGSRTIDPLRNLPMVAGASPVSAYRTLDRPAMTPLIGLASAPLDGSVDRDSIRDALRALGVGVRVLDPLEPGQGDPIPDPILASWIYGSWGKSAPPYRAWTAGPALPRAFFVPGVVPERADTQAILQTLRTARPLTFASERPEEFAVEGITEGPGTVVVSILNDSGWRVIDEGDSSRITIPRVIFANEKQSGWQSIPVSSASPVRLRWIYDDSSIATGRRISVASWILWGLAAIGPVIARRLKVLRG